MPTSGAGRESEVAGEKEGMAWELAEYGSPAGEMDVTTQTPTPRFIALP